MSDEGADQRSRERWSTLASEIERLNQTDPNTGVARAEAWLGEEASGECRARALLAFANALRFAGLYERAEPEFVFCPWCQTRLKRLCSRCERPLMLRWKMCPYCGTASLPTGRAPRPDEPVLEEVPTPDQETVRVR